MPEREPHQRENPNNRGDAIEEPEGAHQEAANGYDLAAAPPEAIATPTQPRGETPDQSGGTDASKMGSPAADPQPIH